MVEFRNVSKIYDGSLPAVYDVSFEINKGEFVFLIGPSGSGKTTVIKMLIRDELPTSGKIYFDDFDLTKLSRTKVYRLRREVGVIFQDFKLVPDKTAYENVAFAMEAAGKKDQEIKETVPYVLDIVGLANRMNAFPRQLSGGEQQRVAIARAIANNPKILIADEPTGNLDPASAWDIVQVLTKINNWGTTVIMSTHGTDIVNSLNKRVIQMDKGKIVRDDNKGQYEITSKFEENMVKEAVKDINEDEPKRKKSFQVTLPKSLDEHNIPENPMFDRPLKKPGFFSKLFGRKIKGENQFDIDAKRDMVGSLNKEETKEEVKEITRPLIVKADKPNKEEVEEQEKKADKADADKDKTEEKEEKEETSLHIDLNKDDEKEEKKDKKNTDTEKRETKSDKKKGKKKGDNISKKTSFDKYKDLIKEDDQTPISELDLSSELLDDLEKSGYEYIEQIINDGPESLLDKIEIDPEEVVKVAKAIKKFIQSKDS